MSVGLSDLGGRRKKCSQKGRYRWYGGEETESYPSRDSATPGVRALIAREGVIARVFQSARFARLRNLGNPCRLEAFPAVCIKPIVAEIASGTLHHFAHRCCLARGGGLGRGDRSRERYKDSACC